MHKYLLKDRKYYTLLPSGLEITVITKLICAPEQTSLHAHQRIAYIIQTALLTACKSYCDASQNDITLETS